MILWIGFLRAGFWFPGKRRSRSITFWAPNRRRNTITWRPSFLAIIGKRVGPLLIMAVLRFDPQAFLIPIEVVIRGKENQTASLLALDTGATYTLIPSKTAKYLNLMTDSRRRVEISTATQRESCPLVIVPKISFLNIEVENVACLVKDLPDRERVEGLLGLSFLRGLEVRINFRKGILEMDRG